MDRIFLEQLLANFGGIALVPLEHEEMEEGEESIPLRLKTSTNYLEFLQELQV